MKSSSLVLCIGVLFLIITHLSCKKADVLSPVLVLNEDTILHFLGQPYIDAGVTAMDDKSCILDSTDMVVHENVDVDHYGTYTVSYLAADDAGNQTKLVRKVDIILQPSDYFSVYYAANDTCTSGIYPYTGLIQDCDCGQNAITVGNISNFGLSALFTLPVDGQYTELVHLDTTRLGVTFLGTGIMHESADTLRWNYTISTGITTDVCVSTWVKE